MREEDFLKSYPMTYRDLTDCLGSPDFASW